MDMRDYGVRKLVIWIFGKKFGDMGKEEVRKLVACERNGSESWRFRKGMGREISDTGKEGIIKLVG